MIDGLKPYPAMKDSGVEWLGEVPEHWGVRRIKSIFREKELRDQHDGRVLLSFSRYHGIVPQATVSDRVVSSDLTNYKSCDKGDLVMNRMQAWSGMLSVSQHEGLVSPDYSVFVPIEGAECEARFFGYQFRTPALVAEFAKRSKGIGTGFNRLYTPDFGAVAVAAPRESEQAAIVRFLDHADQRIRRYIGAKEKLIALLEEQKQAIIQQAVTGQIDVRTGRPYPAYKDSGVEWLGRVPEHWGLERAKWLFKRVERPAAEGTDVVTCFRDGVVTLRKNRRLDGFTESLTQSGYQGIFRGDLVIHNMDAFAGAIGVSDSCGKGTSVYSVCVPKLDSVNARYYALCLREMARNKWILALSRGIRERSTDFRFSVFASQELPLPSIAEQSVIVRFLDHADQRIQRCIDATKRQIGLLCEHRVRLFADVVTGKLDVRDVSFAQSVSDTHTTTASAKDDELDLHAEVETEEDAGILHVEAVL